MLMVNVCVPRDSSAQQEQLKDKVGFVWSIEKRSRLVYPEIGSLVFIVFYDRGTQAPDGMPEAALSVASLASNRIRKDKDITKLKQWKKTQYLNFVITNSNPDLRQPAERSIPPAPTTTIPVVACALFITQHIANANFDASFEINNITVRKTKKTNSMENILIENLNNNSSLLDTTMMSLPNTSMSDSEDIINYKDTIKRLTMELESAHLEIENLNSENFRLKMDIGQYQKVIETYKKNELLFYPTKLSIQPIITQQHTDEITQTPSDVGDMSFDTAGSFCSSEGIKHTNLQAKTEVQMTTEDEEWTNNSQSKKSLLYKPNEQHKPNKICILSTNKENKVLSIAEEMIEKRFNFCHYLTPGGSMYNLLDGIKTKLADYTKNDYCVILIGEQDFKISNNYYKLTVDIRNTLIDITHTNIIICLPTYKYNINSNMYNWRVMNFNQSLYQDNQKYKYAYVMDSNANIEYDYNTFFRKSGQINNYGLRTIFVSIIKLIKDIQCLNSQSQRQHLITLTPHEPTHPLFTNSGEQWLCGHGNSTK
ncbi:hypothetical protein HW555_002357 [Spodoptera exigua]|uniref:Uncharacterized protein n=1 Tax=Spodoptera exigua TaxID=7107 RepID=A0A835L7Y1_SPOEX|nr:hypothetical protein HW555_002357 [Spodoptera exigua]